jgi:hypothetical protein
MLVFILFMIAIVVVALLASSFRQSVEGKRQRYYNELDVWSDKPLHIDHVIQNYHNNPNLSDKVQNLMQRRIILEDISDIVWENKANNQDTWFQEHMTCALEISKVDQEIKMALRIKPQNANANVVKKYASVNEKIEHEIARRKRLLKVGETIRQLHNKK